MAGRPGVDPNDESKKRYSAEFWFPMNDARYQQNYQMADAAWKAAAAAKWGQNIPQFRNPPIIGLQSETHQGFKIRASTKQKVAIRKKDPMGGFVDVTDPEEIYAGMIVAAALKADAYENQGSCGVRWYLNQVMLLADGPRLSNSARTVEEEFGSDLEQMPFGTLATPQELQMQQHEQQFGFQPGMPVPQQMAGAAQPAAMGVPPMPGQMQPTVFPPGQHPPNPQTLPQQAPAAPPAAAPPPAASQPPGVPGMPQQPPPYAQPAPGVGAPPPAGVPPQMPGQLPY